MRIVVIALVVVVIAGAAPKEETVSLKAAGSSGLVSFSGVKNPQSTHYLKPVMLSLKNKTARTLSVEIPVGYRFLPADTGMQPMLVVKPELIVLGPNELKVIYLEAMCHAHNKSSASDGMIYSLGTEAKGNLLEIAREINRMQAYNSEGQQAVWCISDNNPPEYIYGADTAATNRLRQFVCKLTGKKLPSKETLNNYRYNYYAPVIETKERIWGSYEFRFAKEKSIIIAMFGRGDVLVRELYKNEHEKPGKNTFSYEFDSSVYTEDAYKIKFIADGKVITERLLNMRDWRARN